MKLVIRVSSGEMMKLPIEYIVAATQPGWKTFSCKRRINEYCDEVGWQMLEEAIKEAHTIYEMSAYRHGYEFEAMRWNRLKELIPWAASMIYYGIDG